MEKSDFDSAFEKMKKDLSNIYENNSKLKTGSNIIRGHVESMSKIFEDIFAKFLNNVLNKNNDEYKFYLDWSLSGNTKDGKKKLYRPDIVIAKNKTIIGIIELKSNLGYCSNKNLCETLDEESEILLNNGTLKITRDYNTIEKYIKNLDGELTDLNIEKIKHKIKKAEEKNNNGEITSITIELDGLEVSNKLIKAVVVLTTKNDHGGVKNNEKNFKNSENYFITLFDGWYYDLIDKDEEKKKLEKIIREIESI